MVLWLFLFALTNKSVFSSVVSFVVVAGFVAANNIKYSVLAKPLMPSDFLLARHFVTTPDLYLRYVNVTSCSCVALCVLAVVAFYILEKKQLARSRHATLLRVLLAALTLTFFTSIDNADSFVAKTYSNNSLRYSSWDPGASVNSSGFFFTFIRLSEGLDFSIPAQYGDPSIVERIAAQAPTAPGTGHELKELPDIVVVQSESFYDLRQHELQLDDAVYAGYDRTAQDAAVSGNLTVPTVGGNTAKTEFSFLTGIETTVLPSGCEYPYRSLVRRNIWSIAWHLRSLGYSTVAIHPYVRTFWDRHIALQFLGFDRFIDGRYFTVDQLEGIYVSDEAVAEKIAEVRKSSKGPLFIFAITMENHGPWDKKRLANRRKFNFQGNVSENDRKQIARYLHHAVNAGDMASDLRRQLEKSGRPSVLAFYGDHAPGFSNSETLPLKPGASITDTPYFIWKNFGRTGHTTRNTSVSFLASEILDQAGINNHVYFRANAYIDDTTSGTFANLDQSEEASRSYTQLLYNNLLGKLSGVRFYEKKML